MQSPPAHILLMQRLGCVLVLLLVLAAAAPLSAQPMRDLVEAALDQQVDDEIEIDEQPVRDALRALEDHTGLRFVVDECAIEWLPYGEQTRIAIKMEDITVRRGLTRILGGLGLTLRVVDDRVVIEPTPMLTRLGRRLTLPEIEVLQTLAHRPWSKIDEDEVHLVVRGAQDAALSTRLREALRGAPREIALVQLEHATQQLGCYWIVDGGTIVVFSRRELVINRLERRVDLDFRSIPLDELLLRLGKMIDVTMHFEPGALEQIGATRRHVDLIQHNVTVRQVLELLAGRSGLVYTVGDDGVHIGAGAAAEEALAPRPMVVAILRVPVGDDGTTLDILIREDQMPAEHYDLVMQVLERKMPVVIDTLRETLNSQP